MRIFSLLFLTILSTQCLAAKLILDGKVHYIDDYQIIDSGKTLIVNTHSKNTRKAASVRQLTKTKSSFGKLWDDLDASGGFKALEDSFKSKKSDKYKNNFR